MSIKIWRKIARMVGDGKNKILLGTYFVLSLGSTLIRPVRLSVKRRKHGLIFVISYIIIWALILLGEVSTFEINQTKADYYEPSTRVDTHNTKIAEFDIGANLTNIWGLDLSSKTFNAEGFIWLKWDKLPIWLEKWDPEIAKQPIKSIGFVNAVDRYDFVKELEPSAPIIDSDMRNIQWLFFSGKFIARDLDLKKFPFESISLPVEIEFDDFYSTDGN